MFYKLVFLVVYGFLIQNYDLDIFCLLPYKLWEPLYLYFTKIVKILYRSNYALYMQHLKKIWNPQQDRPQNRISDQICHSNTVKWKCATKQLLIAVGFPVVSDTRGRKPARNKKTRSVWGFLSHSHRNIHWSCCIPMSNATPKAVLIFSFFQSWKNSNYLQIIATELWI